MFDQPAIQSAAVADDGESIALMEPTLIAQASPHRGLLTDLAVELAARAAGLRRSLPQGVSAALADLVRAMNCYYSNLIEGHDTHPVDIERALRHDYSARPARPEPAARSRCTHSRTALDRRRRSGRSHRDRRGPVRAAPALLHRPAGGDAPLGASGGGNKRPCRLPGALRTRRVRVGLHLPVSPGALPRFLQRFEAVYGNLGRADAILGAPPRRITGCCGFIRSWTATAAWRA